MTPTEWGAAAQAGQVGQVRWLTAWLPVPLWDKNTRTSFNRKTGGRFTLPEARLYRDMVKDIVGVALPKRPWFEAKTPWHINLSQYVSGDADVDHYVSGILDDLVVSGLASSDTWCKAAYLTHVDADFDGILLWASQVLAPKPSDDGKAD